jgi:hypothetical protein
MNVYGVSVICSVTHAGGTAQLTRNDGSVISDAMTCDTANAVVYASTLQNRSVSNGEFLKVATAGSAEGYIVVMCMWDEA